MNCCHPTTNIPYGYVAAAELDDDIVAQMLYGTGVTDFIDHSLAAAEAEAKVQAERRHQDMNEHLARSGLPLRALPEWEGSDEQQDFRDDYDSDECQVEGKLESVHYRSSWLGGALNFMLYWSPHVTQTANKASPCVPGAAILSRSQDGNVEGYTIPPNWWREDF